VLAAPSIILDARTMSKFTNRSPALPLLLAFVLSQALFAWRVFPAEIPLQPGASFQWGDRTATIKKVEHLPVVESEYTKRFKFDSSENPKLSELRERYHLETVIASGTNELDQQILLMDWVHNRFKKFGQPSIATRGALDILNGIDQGHTFFCTQYAQLFASSAASLGWIDRVLALRRHQGVARGGSTEHSTTEIWSNQHRKWVMLDPTSNFYLEMNGVPLNAFEIRQEWFYNDGRELVFVVGKEKRRYRKADLPISLKWFDRFGELKLEPDELDKYGFIGYIPNTDLMDSGFDYAQMFIVKDKLCDGTQWHQRTLPANPVVDPYFPINQAALRLETKDGKIKVELSTMTPNLDHFEFRIDEGPWLKSHPSNSPQSPPSIEWTIHPGANRFEARTRNRFGVYGPISTIEFQY
jgi:hypothetical protein